MDALEVCGITKDREAHRVLDCDELGDVKTLSVVVSDQAPGHHTDDRILEELHVDLAVHQTVDSHVVAVGQTDIPHLTVPSGAGETQNLQTRMINRASQSDNTLLL